MSETVYSVSQLNREAKRLLANHFLTVQVSGEISNLSLPSSGHIYFTLKDAQAQIRCAMFKGQQQRLRFKPANGAEVIATAQVSLYEPRGDYQLVVEHLEAAGDGALRLAFERLKQQLSAQGWFDLQRKRPIPLIPRRIAVITSASGAAIHDILTVLKRRFPAIPVVIYPVAVQGDTAQFEIARALATANQQALADVIILARGGGSLEDLWAFNEELVARAIIDSEIPVIAGIGHEVDVTIADFVADLRAATPSAAAEHAVPQQSEWLAGFAYRERQLQQLMQRQLSQRQQQLNWQLKALLQQHPGQQLQRNQQRLDELEQRMSQAIQYQLRHHRQRWTLTDYRFRQSQPTQAIQQHRQQLHYWQQVLIKNIHNTIERFKQRQAATAQTLQAVSPLATLERGYSISQRQDDQQIIKSSRQLQPNQLFISRFADGQVLSQVKEIIHDKKTATPES